MSSSTFPVEANARKTGIRWFRVIQSTLNIVLFLGIAAVAIPVCLGYRINWQARSITQTGLIELDGPQENLDMRIFVNNILQDGTFPFRQNWVFPGGYKLRVERDGYQAWEKDIEVEANRRSVFDTLILIYNQPKQIPVPSKVTAEDVATRTEGSSGVEVKSGNELFVKGKYQTSTSQNIVTARWYTDHNHIVYQTGTSLILFDIEAQTTQLLASFTTKEPVPYIFQDGGRVLIYNNGGLHAVTLFEPITLIDRLGVGQ